MLWDFYAVCAFLSPREFTGLKALVPWLAAFHADPLHVVTYVT